MTELTEKSEADILRVLRSRYEKEGYTFLPHPSGSLVPPFLGNYRPDALAISDTGSVVIEIRSRGPSMDRRLSEIAEIVERQPNWKFQVFYTSSFKGDTFHTPSSIAIIEAVREVLALKEGGHYRAAFLMAWSALEALARRLHADVGTSRKAMIPSEIIEWLSQSGDLGPDSAKILRKLVRVRNAVVHGDLNVEVSPKDADVMIEVLISLLPQVDEG